MPSQNSAERVGANASWTKLAWPAVFALMCVLLYSYFDRGRQLASDGVRVKSKSTATVVRELRELARLEALAVHVEKVVDVTDEQKVLFNQIDASDSLVFVAAGEVTLGVDLSKLRDEDVRFDPATRAASIRLPPLETLHARLDEEHSYVHSRSTALLARRNERLEGEARKLAITAFERAAADPALRERAKTQAEQTLGGLAHAFGVATVSFEWRNPATEP